MILEKVFERFVGRAPISVMMAATMRNVLSAERLDAIFESTAVEQYKSELLFSTVADIMGSVVCQIHPSVNAAFKDREAEIGVTVKAVYDKLKGIETAVSRELVRETASRMRSIIRATKGFGAPLLEGYQAKIVDGNHLRRTDRRIGELRDLNVAPLPGKSLVVYDPQIRLVVDALPCEDGHASERSLLNELLETVERDDLWFGDRNFSTAGFLCALDERKAKAIIRQHGRMAFELQGERQQVGETETGVIYEQPMTLKDPSGEIRNFRRITIELFEPTRDGVNEIHLVTNLPKRVKATRVAELYRNRWKIETAFQEVAESLEGEIATLGYPKAALFGFCMALVTHNLLSVVRAAVHAAHGDEAASNFSTYYAAHEVASKLDGMLIALDADFWQARYGELTPKQMAKELKGLAKNIRLSKYTKGK